MGEQFPETLKKTEVHLQGFHTKADQGHRVTNVAVGIVIRKLTLIVAINLVHTSQKLI